MSDYLLDSYVMTKPGQAYRLFPFGKIVKGGKERIITPEVAAKFRLPHFKPPIKLGSHNDATPAGGHIVALEVREDGLYAIPEINDEGESAINKGAYRYHSPEVVWDDGYLEDPTSGEHINGPLIVGDALLHMPHLGEAAALYSIKEQSEVKNMTETVQVPVSFWEKFLARFEREPEQPEQPQKNDGQPERFDALQAERDELAAKVQAMEAEKEQAARVDAFAVQLKETKVSAGADVLAGMTDEQAEWVMQQFKALSAQIDESALTQPVGSDGAGADNPLEILQAKIGEVMQAEGVDYSAALRKVQATEPNLIVAAYPRKEGK